MPTRSGTSSSSMHTTASFDSSFMDGSPPRQSPSRSARKHRGSLIRDPYESPSRQLAVEFDLRLSISDRDFNERLDQAAAQRAKLHDEQLARAAEEHNKVLRSAELEIQRILLEEEQARLRREQAQQQEVERLKREKAQQEAEAQKRLLEAKLREEEAARRAAEQQKKIQEAEARIKEQEAAAEKQKAKDEADRKAKEAAEKARTQPRPQPTLHTPAAAPPRVAATPTPTSAPASNVEQIHAKYLELHARMKEFRLAFENEHSARSSPLKRYVGDARRDIRLRINQVTTEREVSVDSIKRIRKSFDVAFDNSFVVGLDDKEKEIKQMGPTIDIRPFLISKDIPSLENEAEAQYPALLLYLFICFEKFTLKQFEKQAAGTDTRTLQEVGLIAASLLSDTKYKWKNIPLTDIFVAKLHRICPLLFGVRGTMETASGRIRLGWTTIDKAEPNEENYGQRLRGLGAGYAALSLRSFSGNTPAIPMAEYWRAVASICSTPTENLWPGHFSILHGLVGDNYRKFTQHYGQHARAVLRRATIDLPRRAPPRCKDAAGPVQVLPLNWKKTGFSLD
jgi:nucleoporin GLE1